MIYLDNNATTGLDAQVREAMLLDLSTTPRNPSSVHAFGREARNDLSKARRKVASLFGVRPAEILFTSGGTEALNTLLRGLVQEKKGHIITSSLEHAAVHETVGDLERLGCSVTALSPGAWGAVHPEQVKEALQPNTRLITLMAVNNETGVMTDLASIGTIAQEAGIPFVVDGVALFGKEAFSLPDGVTAICFSGHKFHGPKGSGFAVIRRSLKLIPEATGGAQEYGRRGGTENLAGILGIAEAAALATDCLPTAADKMRRLRDRLEKGICSQCPWVKVNGEGPRVSNTSNLAFDGVEGDALLMNLDLAGIAVSHGSACSTGSLEPSRILLNMGYSRGRAASSVRFSLSRFTTEAEIDKTIEEVVAIANRLRGC